MANPRWYLAAVVALAACGKSKLEQCNKVIERYNAVGEVIRAGFGDGSDPTAIEANAAAIEKATTEFAAVDVSDDKLAKVRADLATLFAKHTANMQAIALAVRDAKDPGRADAANKRLAEATSAAETIAPAIAAAKQALMTECHTTAKN
jgi:hypothetical protein